MQDEHIFKQEHSELLKQKCLFEIEVWKPQITHQAVFEMQDNVQE